MNLYKIIAIIIGFIILSGCQDKKKQTYLKEINAMDFKIDSLDKVSKEKRVDTINSIVMSVRSTISSVKDVYFADTIDMKIATMMNEYKEIRKVLSSNTGNISKATKALPEVKQKLKDLEHDINEGVGEREKYQEYINYEKNKIEEIESLLDYYIITNDKYISRYDSLHPLVVNFADSLKAHNEK
ncbi:MAG: hypothetical protein WEA99_04550 [Brumimicrobium sp.]